MNDVRQLLLDLLGRGPATLLADGAHPGCHGLPAQVRGRPLWLQLAGPSDRARVAADGNGLVLPYGNLHGSDDDVFVPWEACFAIGGLDGQGRPGCRLRTEELPSCLGQDPLRTLQALLGQLGYAPPMIEVQWNLRVEPRLLLDDGDRSAFEPEPRGALQRLLDDHGGAWVLAEPDGPVPPGQPPVLQLAVARQPGIEDLVLDDGSVSWTQPHPEGGRLAVCLPWSRIGAMQALDGGLGWFWPAALPEPMRAGLQRHPELWPHLERLRGIPLTPPKPADPPDLPVLGVLPPPRDLPPRAAVEHCLHHGGAVLLADARRSDVVVPEGLRTRGLVILPTDLPDLAADVRLDDHGVTLTVPDDQGRLARVSVAWPALFVAGSTRGQMRVHGWPERYPDELLVALGALQQLARNDGKPPRPIPGLIPPGEHTGDSPGIGLGRNERGEYVLRLEQPCGPAGDDGRRPSLQVELCLPLPPTH